jgi:hypothetical protein
MAVLGGAIGRAWISQCRAKSNLSAVAQPATASAEARRAKAERRSNSERNNYRGARLARMRCRVRRCMLSRRAVSETLRLHIS